MEDVLNVEVVVLEQFVMMQNLVVQPRFLYFDEFNATTQSLKVGCVVDSVLEKHMISFL
jgi:hypothetical protein